MNYTLEAFINLNIGDCFVSAPGAPTIWVVLQNLEFTADRYIFTAREYNGDGWMSFEFGIGVKTLPMWYTVGYLDTDGSIQYA